MRLKSCYRDAPRGTVSDTTCPEGAHEKPWLLGASRHRPDTRSPLLWHSTRCSWPSHLRARGAAEDRGEGRRGQFDPWTHRIRTGRASRPRHDPHSAHLGAVRTSSSAEEISATTQRTEASPAAAELRRPFLSSSDALRGCAAMSLRAGGSLARRATAQKLGRTDSPPKKLGGILRNWNRICFNRRAGNNRCRFMQMLLARVFGSRLDSVVVTQFDERGWLRQ